MWKIIKTTDNKYLGVQVPFVEEGQVLTFEDGGVFPVTKTFSADAGNTLLACTATYQITFTKE